MTDIHTINGSIVLVEDDAFMGRAYREGLENAGYAVRVATDGQEVWHLLEESIPDLIVLDLMMPVQNGFEVLDALKAHDTYQHIPVVVLTVLNQEIDMARAKQAGAIDYLVKQTLSLREMVERITGHMHTIQRAKTP